ncbi:adenylate cyclase [Rhizobium deserti]|uniref:Adenylate cyclase n=1 Tax=Rhizobium deserti TaxID=2547961 RepID=A0A4R5U9D5_9HYPH|nr:winged helix-turn-helix domain-containing protein [Rhizobium deserti]TDK31213.1 adenylate cyclase [Rhizobium deserti]
MAVLRFLDFELDGSRRQLTRAGQHVKLGSKALDILVVLASKAGEVVTREELFDAVWSGSASAENSLRVQIMALRKALGTGDTDGLVQSVAGRGYLLSASVQSPIPVEMPAPRPLESKGNLPGIHTAVIGREDFIQRCIEARRTRVMSVVGPGGIGKTTVAIEFANTIREDYESAFFLDLAALNAGASIGPTLASLMGLSVYGADPMPGIITAVGQRKMIFVFDNCEHIIEQAAEVIGKLSLACPNVFILATSREPLGIPSEMVRRLGPLDTPAEGECPVSPSSYSAMAMFMDRVEHSLDIGSLNQIDDLVRVAAIVRKLDGIPLAIEFAAARVIDLGLDQLLNSLNQPLTVLRRGRRTAPHRQQTLQATLDWSYGFLTENEKTVLQALSVFAQTFSRDGAAAICDPLLGNDDIEDAIWGLHSKSLLSRSEAGSALRLLETTREYASIKLLSSMREAPVRDAHARFVLSRLRDAELEWDKLATYQWLSSYGGLINDLRLALAFCEKTRNSRLFLELVAGSGMLWTQLGLMNEQFLYIERAIEVLDLADIRDPAIDTQLRSAYGAIAYNVHSVAGDGEAIRQFDLAASSARMVGDATKILRARSGVCAVLTTQGRYRAACELAVTLRDELGIAAESAVNRILAHNSHYLGNHEEAFAMAEKALHSNGVNVRGTLTSGANFGQKTLCLMIMAKTAYLRGEITNSLELLDELIADVMQVDHPISTCLALSVGVCPVYFGLGMNEKGRYYLEILRGISTRNSLVRWQEWADGFDYALGTDVVAPSAALDNLKLGGNGPRLENTITIGGERIGLDLLEMALSGEAGWCEPELLRLKGIKLLQRRNGEGRQWLSQGFELASRQSALAWKLRCANSLASFATAATFDEDRRLVERLLRQFAEAPPIDLVISERILEGAPLVCDAEQ